MFCFMSPPQVNKRWGVKTVVPPLVLRPVSAVSVLLSLYQSVCMLFLSNSSKNYIYYKFSIPKMVC